MEALISALGLVIGTLMGLPSRTVAASDAKKSKIGKALFQFVNALDAIINRGNSILDKIEAVALASNDSEFQSAVEDLRNLAECQIESLQDAGGKLHKELRWWEGYEEDSQIRDLLARPTDVTKILSIYEPDLGQSIYAIFDLKKNMLRRFASYFRQSVESLNRDNLKIKEIIFIQPDFLQGDIRYLDWYSDEEIAEVESQGLIKTRTLNLCSTPEREDYLQRARKRLNDLQSARHRLAELIKRYYEPHHLC